jgi:hypothetical protein
MEESCALVGTGIRTLSSERRERGGREREREREEGEVCFCVGRGGGGSSLFGVFLMVGIYPESALPEHGIDVDMCNF